MEKIELAKEKLGKQDSQTIEKGDNKIVVGLKTKLSVFWRWFFGFTKLAIGLFLLPFVYSATIGFLNEISLVSKPLQDYFWAGVISLIIIHLLVWEPAVIYSKGHKLLEIIFNFFKPLLRVAPYLLPIYTIVLYVGYIIFSPFFKSSPDFLNYFMFLFGASMALHMIFSAKTLRSKKEDFLKSNYIFGFSFIYIINLGILSLALSLILEKFSFVDYSNQTFLLGKHIFNAIFKQLFF